MRIKIISMRAYSPFLSPALEKGEKRGAVFFFGMIKHFLYKKILSNIEIALITV